MQFEYVFPAIRGVQAGREYYVSMCPLRLIPKIFVFDDEELSADMRAQRTLNKGRIPEISRYLLENPSNYVFSALTVSIDAEVKFEALPAATEATKTIGSLHIPMKAKFLINDGQHRRAAIESALRENPELGDETISIVFFLDVGLKRSQQMFADLNRHAIRVTPSLGILYDHRDDTAQIVKDVVKRVATFRQLTELERSSLSERSGKLFTLSSLHGATKHLLAALPPNIGYEDQVKICTEFWEQVSEQMPDWQLVASKKTSAGEVRRESLNCHSVALAAIGRTGEALLRQHPKGWKKRLETLKRIDWSRSNTRIWEGRAIQSGQVSKTRAAVALTSSYLKKQMGLSLTQEETRFEKSHTRTELRH